MAAPRSHTPKADPRLARRGAAAHRPLWQICPHLRDHQLAQLAEIMACADPDPKRRREHRMAKLSSYPLEDQVVVRAAFNQVLKVRAA